MLYSWPRWPESRLPQKASARASEILRRALWEASQTAQQTDGAFRDELQKQLNNFSDDDLASSLVAFVGPDADRRAALTNTIGRIARQLAPGEAPPSGDAATLWPVLVSVADRLNGSGAYPLGRLDFISNEIFEQLLDEARSERPADADSRRSIGQAGDALAALAMSRQLREAVGSTLGFPVTATGDALYEFDPPGSHVRTHVDSRDYEIVYHLLLEHGAPKGRSSTSVLIAHLPDTSHPTRLPLNPGESLVLRGRGTIHSWKALGDDERRILIAVGFAAAAGAK